MKSIKVERALKRLGQQMKDARRQRGIPIALMAEKLGISRNTWSSLEKGSSGVRLEIFLGALIVFDRLDELVKTIESDTIGIFLMDEKLPKRVRIPSLSTDIKKAKKRKGEQEK